MGIAFQQIIQTDPGNAGSSATETAVMGAQTAGNTMFAAVSCTVFTPSTPTASVADTKGNTWVQVGTKITTGAGPTVLCMLFATKGGIKQAAASANTVTVTFSGGASFTFCSIMCAEYSGVDTVTPFYGANNTNNGGATSAGPAQTPLTAVSTEDWYVAAGAYTDNDDTGTFVGLTQRGVVTTNDSLAFGDKQAIATTATNVGWNIGSTEHWTVLAAVMRAATWGGEQQQDTTRPILTQNGARGPAVHSIQGAEIFAAIATVALGSPGWFDVKPPPIPPCPPNRPTEPAYLGFSQATLGPSSWVDWIPGSSSTGPSVTRAPLPNRPTEPGYFGLAQASLGPSTWQDWSATSLPGRLPRAIPMENWAPFDVTTSNVVLGSSGWFDTKAPPTPPRPPNRPTEPAYLGVSLGWAPTTWQDWGAGSAAAPRARYIAPDTWVPFDVTAAAFVASSIGWMDQGVAPPRAAARLLMVDPTGASSNTSTLQTFLETPEQPRRTLPWPRPTEPGYFGLAQASLGPSTWVEWAAGSWAPRPFIDKPTDEAYFAATAIKGPTAWVDWGGAQREGRVYRAPQTDPAYLGLSLGWAPTSWLDWAGPPIAARASPRVPPDNWAPWSVTTAPAALATFPWQSDPVRTPAPKRQPEMAMPFFGTGDISPPALTAFQRWQDEPIPTKPPFPRPTPDAYFSGAAKLGPSGWVEWAVPYVVRAPRPNLQTEPAYLGVSLGWAPTSWVDWSGRDLAPARPPPWPRPTEPAFFSGQATLGPVRWVDWGPPYIVQPPGPKRPVATDYVPFDGLPAFVALPFWQPDRDRVPPAPRAWPTPDPWTGVPFVLSPRAWVQYSNEPTRPPYPPRFSENHTPIWPLTPPPTLGEFFDWSGEARPKPDPSPADLNATWSWLPIPNWAGGPLLFPPVPELQIGNAISPTVFICLVGNAVPIICTFFDLITQVETDPTSVFAVLESPDGTTQQLTLQRNGPGVYATVVLIQQPQDSIVRFTGVMGISPVSVEGTINAVAPATPGPAGPPTQSPPPPPAPIWTAVSFSTPLPFQMTPTVNEIAVDGRGGPVPLLVWQNPGPSDKFTVNDWYDASASGGVITVTSQDTSLIEDPGAPGTYKQTIHIADFSKFVGTWQYSAVFNQWGLKSR